MWADLRAFYKSSEWYEFKQRMLLSRLNDEGVLICWHCHKPILKFEFDPTKNTEDTKGKNSDTVIWHHKEELKTVSDANDYNKSLNPDNVEPVHFKCHNEIHDRFQGGVPRKKVYIVHGSPCSGKTTWAREQMGEQDILLDIDDLWEFVSKKPRYVKPNAYKDLVFALWNEYLDQIYMRTGFWNNAYIISGEALSTTRDKMADKYNAELIHIDTTKQECLERLYNNPQGRSIPDYEKYINLYFDKFTE